MNEKCCEKKKVRTAEECKRLINRLNRIEGQVRGIKNMIENDSYCNDVLIQVTAVNSALNSFSRELLSDHIKSCVVNDIKNGNDEIVDELLNTLQKMMR